MSDENTTRNTDIGPQLFKSVKLEIGEIVVKHSVVCQSCYCLFDGPSIGGENLFITTRQLSNKKGLMDKCWHCDDKVYSRKLKKRKISKSTNKYTLKN
jgi:hypothetical protein